jgi:Fe-S-cluster containining protein
LGYTTRFDNGEDIAKPAGVPCRYLTNQGCGIYEVRPQLCRKFKCDWLQKRKGLRAEDAPMYIGAFFMNGDRFEIAELSENCQLLGASSEKSVDVTHT